MMTEPQRLKRKNYDRNTEKDEKFAVHKPNPEEMDPAWNTT